MNKPVLDIVVPTYEIKEAPMFLSTLINSFLVQTSYIIGKEGWVVRNPNTDFRHFWQMNIVVDGKASNFCRLQDSLPPNVKFTFLDGGPFRDFGYTQRSYGLRNSTCEWILFANHDDYYLPIFLERVLPELQKPDCIFVYWDILHSHYGHNFFLTYLEKHRVDIGSFLSRTKLAREVSFCNNYDADGRFVEEYVRRFKGEGRIVKINQVLNIHN